MKILDETTPLPASVFDALIHPANQWRFTKDAFEMKPDVVSYPNTGQTMDVLIGSAELKGKK